MSTSADAAVTEAIRALDVAVSLSVAQGRLDLVRRLGDLYGPGCVHALYLKQTKDAAMQAAIRQINFMGVADVPSVARAHAHPVLELGPAPGEYHTPRAALAGRDDWENLESRLGETEPATKSDPGSDSSLYPCYEKETDAPTAPTSVPSSCSVM